MYTIQIVFTFAKNNNNYICITLKLEIMRLSNEFIKKDWGKIQSNAHNYMVLDIEHLGFNEDEQAFETGIDVINLYNTLRMVNKFFDKAGISESIETSIIGEMINSVYTGKPFTDSQLEKMVNLYNSVEHLAESIKHLAPMLMNAAYIPTSVIMSLIGFNLCKQHEFERTDSAKFTDTKEEFYKLEDKLFEGEITVKEFRKLGLTILNEAVKSKA